MEKNESDFGRMTLTFVFSVFFSCSLTHTTRERKGKTRGTCSDKRLSRIRIHLTAYKVGKQITITPVTILQKHTFSHFSYFTVHVRRCIGHPLSINVNVYFLRKKMWLIKTTIVGYGFLGNIANSDDADHHIRNGFDVKIIWNISMEIGS